MEEEEDAALKVRHIRRECNLSILGGNMCREDVVRLFQDIETKHKWFQKHIQNWILFGGRSVLKTDGGIFRVI